MDLRSLCLSPHLKSVCGGRLACARHLHAAHNLPVLRSVAAEGTVDTAILEAVEAAGVNVLAVQVSGHTVAPWVQSLLRRSRSAVLITHAPVAHRV